MKIKVIDKGNGSISIKEITPIEFRERIKGSYVFPKIAQEEFWLGKTKQIETPFYIYEVSKCKCPVGYHKLFTECRGY